MSTSRAQGATEPTAGFRAALEAILATNVIHADTLADAAEIELVAYEPGANGTFIREWSRPLDPAAASPTSSRPLRAATRCRSTTRSSLIRPSPPSPTQPEREAA